MTPSGMISFESECYCERSSDPFITSDSDFLKLLEPGGQVMAVKVFLAPKNRLMDRCFNCYTSIFTRFNTKEEIEKSYNIASVRIHVQRCIARIKMYSILNKITIDLQPHH